MKPANWQAPADLLDSLRMDGKTKMTLIREFEISTINHTPDEPPDTPRLKEKALEFVLSRDDFNDPKHFDQVFGSNEAFACWAIKSTDARRPGVERVWYTFTLKEDSEGEELLSLWVVDRQGEGSDPTIINSIRGATHWKDRVLRDLVKPGTLPEPSIS